MPPFEKSFDSIANIPVHYARSPIAPYGTIGVRRNFQCTHEFYEKLTTCFEDLAAVCPLGPPDVIVCAGAFVDKPNSMHQFGRAFDLDALFWSEKEFVTNHYLNDKAFYLGVEAVLRRHFGTVLQYLYDRRHEDHFHFDDGTPIDFVTSRASYVYFVQSTLNILFGEHLEEDGQWGNLTSGAVKRVFDQLSIPLPITTRANWKSYLDVVVHRSFAFEQIRLNPKQLLAKVYESINTSNIDPLAAKRIESSLTAFAMAPETREFLTPFH